MIQHYYDTTVYLQFYMSPDRKYFRGSSSSSRWLLQIQAISGFAREKMVLLLIVRTDFHQLERWSRIEWIVSHQLSIFKQYIWKR